jgi:hypothetical protein
MDRAVRLVRDEGWCVVAAAKEAEVPRMTLSDRLKNYEDPTKLPAVGRPQELTRAEEEAIVKCLVMCAEFQYPMQCCGSGSGIQDPGSGTFLPPGSGIRNRFFPDPGSHHYF